MSSYNYDEFSPDMYDLQSADGPEVGQKAPDFKLLTVDGTLHSLLDFKGECLVLEIGSATCPLFNSRRDTMLQIALDFPQVSSAVLYVREAHPGADISAHKNMGEKVACASLLKSEFNDPRIVFVDDIDGHAHMAYGSMPNAVYIIDKHHIVRFKAPWNNAKTTRRALEAILEGKSANIKSYFVPAKPKEVFSTAKLAGKGSAADFFKGLPVLIWNVLIKNNIRTFFR